jgi:hypothetical protein
MKCWLADALEERGGRGPVEAVTVNGINLPGTFKHYCPQYPALVCLSSHCLANEISNVTEWAQLRCFHNVSYCVGAA